MNLLLGMAVPARRVFAVCCFKGGPGREREAALAWSFELRYYFLRGVPDEMPPSVGYSDDYQLYTVSGVIITTHPGDTANWPKDSPGGLSLPVGVFSNPDEPWDLDFCGNPERRARLRGLYARNPNRFDGTDGAETDPVDVVGMIGEYGILSPNGPLP